MAKTYPLNTANPPGGSDRRSGDDYIRQIALAVAELMEKDHYIGANSSVAGNTATGYTEDAAGEHAKVTLRQASKPTNAADKGFLYTKEGESGTTELFYEDEAGNEIQITKGGLINLANAYAAGLLAPKTDDGSDSSSVSISGGGAAAVGRGANISLYGNEHVSKPGKMELCAGYSEGTTKADISVFDSKLTDVADPTEDQDAVTKTFLDTKVGSVGNVSPADFQADGGEDSRESITFPNGLIMKSGFVSHTTNTDKDIDFDTAFPNGIISVQLTPRVSQNDIAVLEVEGAPTVSGFRAAVNQANYLQGIYWMAIGY